MNEMAAPLRRLLTIELKILSFIGENDGIEFVLLILIIGISIGNDIIISNYLLVFH